MHAPTTSERDDAPILVRIGGSPAVAAAVVVDARWLHRRALRQRSSQQQDQRHAPTSSGLVGVVGEAGASITMFGLRAPECRWARCFVRTERSS